MRRSEAEAEELLHHLGCTGIVHEPRGRSTMPDFQVDPGIAVEVTRLVKTIEIDGRPHVIDADRTSILQSLFKVMAEFQERKTDATWSVRFRFRRPLPRPEVPRALRQRLDAFLSQKDTPDTSYNLKVSPNLTVALYKTDHQSETPFVFIGYSDSDQSGWVVADLLNGIRRAISEKTSRARNVSGYSHCWLFVSYAWSVSSDDTALLRDHLPDTGPASSSSALAPPPPTSTSSPTPRTCRPRRPRPRR